MGSASSHCWYPIWLNSIFGFCQKNYSIQYSIQCWFLKIQFNQFFNSKWTVAIQFNSIFRESLILVESEQIMKGHVRWQIFLYLGRKFWKKNVQKGGGGVLSNPRKFIGYLRKLTHIYEFSRKKRAMKFPKIVRGGQRPFGLFPKKHPILGTQTSL